MPGRIGPVGSAPARGLGEWTRLALRNGLDHGRCRLWSWRAGRRCGPETGEKAEDEGQQNHEDAQPEERPDAAHLLLATAASTPCWRLRPRRLGSPGAPAFGLHGGGTGWPRCCGAGRCELRRGKQLRAGGATQERLQIGMDCWNQGRIKDRRQLGDRPRDGVETLDACATARRTAELRLAYQADPSLHQPPMPRFQDRRHGRRLLPDPGDAVVSGVSVLPESSAGETDLPVPVLGVHHHNAARTDQDVVKICLGPPRPVDIVDDLPAKRLNLSEFLSEDCFARCTQGPGVGVPLGVLQLPSQTCNPFSCEPRLLRGSFSCSHDFPQAASGVMPVAEAMGRWLTPYVTGAGPTSHIRGLTRGFGPREPQGNAGCGPA